MKFLLTFDCNNDAFEENSSAESARILLELSEKISRGYLEGVIRDINGNSIGKYSFSE